MYNGNINPREHVCSNTPEMQELAKLINRERKRLKE